MRLSQIMAGDHKRCASPNNSLYQDYVIGRLLGGYVNTLIALLCLGPGIW